MKASLLCFSEEKFQAHSCSAELEKGTIFLFQSRQDHRQNFGSELQPVSKISTSRIFIILGPSELRRFCDVSHF